MPATPLPPEAILETPSHPAPVIAELSPVAGRVGSRVTVRGSNFAPHSYILINGNVHSLYGEYAGDTNSSGVISFSVPKLDGLISDEILIRVIGETGASNEVVFTVKK